MPAVEIAKLLQDYGLVGALALVLAGAGWLVRKLIQSYEARIKDADKASAMLERASATNATVTAALESRTGRFERLEQRVDEAQRASAANDGLILAKLNELDRNVDELRRGARP